MEFSILRNRLSCIFLIAFFVLIKPGTNAQTVPWVWAEGVHTSAAEWSNSIACDTTSNTSIAVGVFNSDLSAFYGSDFIGAVGGGFVAKYDALGNVIWAFKIGNNQNAACQGVAIDGTGNVYVTGYFSTTADFKGTYTVSTNLSSTGGKDVFVAKYNSAGQLQWVNQGGGASDDEGMAITVNATQVFVTGYFSNSGTFSGIPTISNKPNQNAFYISYNMTGAALWLTDSGSGLSCFGRAIAADNTNVYITGDFMNSTFQVYDYTGALVATVSNSNATTSDILIIAIAVGGPFNWLKTIGSNNGDFGRGIQQNSSGLFLTGSTSAGANFPGYVSNPVATSAIGLDPFVASVSKAGVTSWVQSEAGPANEEGTAIAIDTLNLLSVTGYFQTTFTLNSGPTLTSSGNQDVFVAALNTLGMYQWSTQAGSPGNDIPHGIASSKTGEIYVSGEYESNAIFGTFSLTPDAPPNIFVAKLGCEPIANNLVSSSQTVCTSSVPSLLLGTAPNGGGGNYNFLWQQSPDNLTWTNASGTNNTQNYFPPALFANTYYRRVVNSTGVCLNSGGSSSILITVTPPPSVAVAGSHQNICSTSTTLSGNTPTIGSGIWTVYSGGGSITSSATPTTSVTGLSSGTSIFQWTISNGACPPSKDTISITVYSPPTTANAGSDQLLCATTNYTMNANAPAVGTGSWVVLSGGATLTNYTNNISSTNNLSIGSNAFIWSIHNGACPNSSDTLFIVNYANPSVANAGTDQIICATTATLNAAIPSVGTGSWTPLSTVTVSSYTSNSATATSFSVGNNALLWTVSNGVCPASTDTLFITLNANPSLAIAGTNTAICSASYNLNANAPAVGTGNWSTLTGTGVISNPTLNTSSVSNLQPGTNAVIWTITNGVCNPTKDTLLITVYAPPSIANAGTDMTLCSDTAHLNATPPLTGTGQWTSLGSATLSNNLLPNAMGLYLVTGSNEFLWTVGNGVCPSSTDTLFVLVNQVPTPSSAGSNQILCTDTVNLTGNNPTIGIGNWSVGIGSGIFQSVSSGSTQVTNAGIGSNIYLWTITNGVCPPSISSVTISVSKNSIVASAGAPQQICINSDSAVLQANNPSPLTGIWNLLSGSGTFSNMNNYNSSVRGLILGQNVFLWTVTNGVCPPSSSTVAITVNPLPTTANAGTNFSSPLNSAVLSANTPINGTGTWSIISGAGAFNNPNSPTTQVNNLQFGPNILQWTISNVVCPDSRSEITIIVNTLAIPNGFSPNGDGTNDAFIIPGLNLYSNVKLMVFNRWGNLVFESDDYQNDWRGDNNSGAALASDTYYYTLEVPALKTYSGFVIIKRN